MKIIKAILSAVILVLSLFGLVVALKYLFALNYIAWGILLGLAILYFSYYGFKFDLKKYQRR